MAITANVIFTLFGLALLTSMAAIEITAVLLILFAITDAARSPKTVRFSQIELIAISGLFITGLLSIVLNQAYDQLVGVLNWLRWIIFYLSASSFVSALSTCDCLLYYWLYY